MRGTVPGHTDIDLLDYTRSLADLDGDAVICVSFLSGSRLGPTLRIPALAGGDGVRTGRAATAALALLKEAPSAVMLVFTGSMTAPPEARQVTAIVAHRVEVVASLAVRGQQWHDLDTELAGTWTPGTSNAGLSLAVDGQRRRQPVPVPDPVLRSSLATDCLLLDPLQDHGGSDARREQAARRLSQLWPSLLLPSAVTDEQAGAALRLLGTPLLLSRTTALATLFPPLRPKATLTDVRAGFPFGFEFTSAAASELLLCELISRAEAHATVGPLSALAFHSWLLGHGSRCRELLDRARVICEEYTLAGIKLQVLELSHITGTAFAGCLQTS